MIYIITGVSRGLGESIAKHYLSEGEKVIGIGRRHSIKHDNFTFIEQDLGNLEALQKINFPKFTGPVTLINNAGVIGPIERMSLQDSIEFSEVFAINTIAPQVLTHKVYKEVEEKSSFTLVNISSGAAKRAIPSWSVYCASKAALNMFSEAFYMEERELGHECKVYCVSPGVIDTGMQEQIRNSSEESFSSHENFVRLKEEDLLYSADEAAQKLGTLLKQPYPQEVFYDLREV